jgi:hypothetical protein
VSDLPAWVYDVVMELERWRDTHPKLHAQYAGSREWQPVDRCGCEPLDHVPANALDRAKAIRSYLDATRPAESDGEPSGGPGTPGNGCSGADGDPGGPQ